MLSTNSPVLRYVVSFEDDLFEGMMMQTNEREMRSKPIEPVSKDALMERTN